MTNPDFRACGACDGDGVVELLSVRWFDCSGTPRLTYASALSESERYIPCPICNGTGEASPAPTAREIAEERAS